MAIRISKTRKPSGRKMDYMGLKGFARDVGLYSKMGRKGIPNRLQIRGFSFSMYIRAQNIDKVIANLIKRNKGSEKAIADSLIDVGKEIKILAESMTPIKTGNLQASSFLVGPKYQQGPNSWEREDASQVAKAKGFVNRQKKKGIPIIALGYSAEYFLPVHEVDRDYTEGNPKARWKFLETAIYRYRNIIRDRLAEAIRKENKKV